MITMMITKDDDKGDDKKLKDQSRTIQEVQDKNQEEFKRLTA